MAGAQQEKHRVGQDEGRWHDVQGKNDVGPGEHCKDLGFYFKEGVNYILKKDYCGSFSLEEYKCLYILNLTMEKKPDFRVRTIWV